MSKSFNKSAGFISPNSKRSASVRSFFFVSSLCACFVLSACQKPSSPEEALRARGEAVYRANCITCHNVNPAQDGSVGPSLKGSPVELVRLRVTEQSYPAGYKPKRDTKIMPKVNVSEEDIKAIVAFLNQA